MSFYNWLVKIFTPKNTEEIKPNLFVQKLKGESIMVRLDKIVKGHESEIVWDKYRVIYPAAWNGKINFKHLIFGASAMKGLFVFGLILYLAWAYKHDTTYIVDINSKLIDKCLPYLQSITNSSSGSGLNISSINWSLIK